MFGAALGIAWYVGKPGIAARVPPRAWVSLLWVLGMLPAWHLSLAKANLYKSRRLTGGAGELWDVVKGVALASVLLAASGLLFRVSFVTPRFVETVWLSATALTVASRLSLQVFLKFVRRAGRNLRFVLVIGSGPRALTLVRRLQAHPELGYRLLGYLDNRQADDDHEKPVSGAHYLGALRELPGILAYNVVDEVFVTLPIKSFYDQIATVIRVCEEQGIRVRLPMDLFDLELASAQVDIVQGIPVLSLATNGVHGWYAVGKRSLDLVVSLGLLIALAPLFLVVAWLIKRDSPGPVFFVQERVGLNKRRFGLIKFRTMFENSEALLPQLLHLNEATGAVFKIRDDPRVTRIGRFLRRTSIDELPQIINVLRGEMSLVGPRPLPLRDVEGFTEDWQRRRFSVKPGITGPWQVSGRSSISFERWMEMDMAYIDSSSLGLDLKILLQTVPAVFRGTGAY